MDSIADAIIANLNGQTVPIPHFEYIGVFDSRDNVPVGRKGIYIFTVSEEITLSREMYYQYNNAQNWNSTNVGAGFNRAYYSPITVGTVFYLGKSSAKTGSVFQRLKVHFGDRTDSATNGIKMRMPERSFVNGKLRVHVFLFEKGNDDRYIIDVVEKKLHEKLRPITGGSQ